MTEQENFSEELRLLLRISYKSKNQHRRTKYFQSLDMARRSLVKFEKQRGHASIELNTLKENLTSVKSGHEFTALLSEIKLKFDELINYINIAEKARTRCVKAASLISGLVSQGRFLPFATVTMATMAKLEGQTRKDLLEFMGRFDNLTILLLQTCRIKLMKEKNRGDIACQTSALVNQAINGIDIEAKRLFLMSRPTVKNANKERFVDEDDVGEVLHSDDTRVDLNSAKVSTRNDASPKKKRQKLA